MKFVVIRIGPCTTENYVEERADCPQSLDAGFIAHPFTWRMAIQCPLCDEPLTSAHLIWRCRFFDKDIGYRPASELEDGD